MSIQHTIESENGSILVDSQESNTLELISGEMYNKFTMGVDNIYINLQIDKYIKEAINLPSNDCYLAIIKLYKFIFLVRDCRGDQGRGFRDIFYQSFFNLYEKMPLISQSLINCIPIYGSWKDIFNMIGKIIDIKKIKRTRSEQNLLQKLTDVVVAQRNHDLFSKEKISLLGKYIPSEKSANKKVAKHLAFCFYDKESATSTQIWKKYRKDNAILNKKLNTVEIMMCSDSYDHILFKLVPGKALNRYRNAFANKITDQKGVRDRFPDNDSRVRGAINFNSFLWDKIVSKKGQSLWPHEIIRPYINQSSKIQLSDEEKILIDNQFNDWINKMVEIMRTNDEFRKIVLFVDVSSSMHGTPIEVSITLGVLMARAIAIVEKEQYGRVIWGNRMIIFSNSPHWFELNEERSLSENINELKNADWIGTNTDFLKVHELILSYAIEHLIEASSIPQMCITFSDMQFDSANEATGVNGRSEYPIICNAIKDNPLLQKIPTTKPPEYSSWYVGERTPIEYSTHHEILTNVYESLGFTMPFQIYWNLRGNTQGSIVKSNQPGVVMLSGFTPSNIKSLFEGVHFKDFKEINTYDMFNNSVSSNRYELIENNIELIFTGKFAFNKYESYIAKKTIQSKIKINAPMSPLLLQRHWESLQDVDNICSIFSDMNFKSETNEYKRMMNTDDEFEDLKKRQIGNYSDEEISKIKQQIDDITRRLDQLETK